jgi:hypothetical protein
MGIQGLFPLIAKHAPGAVRTMPGTELSTARVAIEFSGMVHQFAKSPAIYGAGHDFGSDGHVALVAERMHAVAQSYGWAVWVLDSRERNPAKQFEDARRRAAETSRVAREASHGDNLRAARAAGGKRDYATMVDSDRTELAASLGPAVAAKLAAGEMTVEVALDAREAQLAKAAFQGGRIDGAFLQRVRAVLTAYGAQSIVAPAGVEAEHLAAVLQRRGEVDYVRTEDTDALCFGAGRMLCKARGPEITCVELDKVLGEMGLTMEQFVDMCILCGSDFTERTVPGVGSARALALIRQYLRIEAILAERGHGDALEGFDFGAAREQFTRAIDYPSLDLIMAVDSSSPDCLSPAAAEADAGEAGDLPAANVPAPDVPAPDAPAADVPAPDAQADAPAPDAQDRPADASVPFDQYTPLS